MNNLLSLSNREGLEQQHFPFLVLKTKPLLDFEKWNSLSCDVMIWNESIVIIDFRTTFSYWSLKARLIQLDFFSLLQKLLIQIFEGQNYLALLTKHPFCGLIILDYLEEKGMEGLYHGGAPLALKWYESLHFSNWFSPIDRLIDHWENGKELNFKASSFRRQRGQVERFIERMHFNRLKDYQQIHPDDFSKRFGAHWGMIWQWTWPQSTSSNLPLFDYGPIQNFIDLHHFPWKNFTQEIRPNVQRTLDYGLNQWESIQWHLREDLEKLCRDCHLGQDESILEMRWEITLFHLEKITLPVHFRHPYQLQSESPNFETACSQIYFSFQSLMTQWKKRDQNLDLPEKIPFIAWRIEITKKLRKEVRFLDLFRGGKKDLFIQKMIELENKIPVSLLRYQILPSFIPEFSYTSRQQKFHGNEKNQSNLWNQQGRLRPYFFDPEVTAITPSPKSPKKFLERVTGHWWADHKSGEYLRDYYMLNYQGQLVWAYRDNFGNWWRHGTFY